jgi:allophanate hydrolase subunit 2
VPPDGRPIVFLPVHPPTGGFPVIAVVHPDDLWRCAQARPGDRLRFRGRPTG